MESIQNHNSNNHRKVETKSPLDTLGSPFTNERSFIRPQSDQGQASEEELADSLHPLRMGEGCTFSQVGNRVCHSILSLLDSFSFLFFSFLF